MKGQSLLENIYGVFFHPIETFRHLSARQEVGRSMLIFSGVYLFGALMKIALADPALPPVGIWPGTPPLNEVAGDLLGIGAIIGVILALFFLFVAAALFHLIAEALGGTGTGMGLLAALGFAFLPQLPYSIASFVAEVLRLPTLFNRLAWLGFFAWVVVLLVLALRESENLTTGRAVLALALPFMALGILTVVAAILVALVLLPSGFSF
ncbi:MAG: hypothetical protein PWP65_568 [Clostridia bacterium]|nr:hypothetical protein [Clostridia bacterium]